MIRKLPLIPTLVVLAAVTVMVKLGFWQLARMHEKAAMITAYAQAQGDGTVREWPGTATYAENERPMPYSRVRTTCLRVTGQSARAGQNMNGRAGWAHTVTCDVTGGGVAEVVLGWSSAPGTVDWTGGAVTGTYLARGGNDWSVIADPPLAGLQANARPDPRTIPNNHWSYAVQWFLFAGVALVIYALALRKRLAAGPREG